MIKRGFDFIVSILSMSLAVPLWVVVSVAIKLDSLGPIFHRSTRIGMGGKPFILYKFRTMVVGAHQIGPGVTRGNDPRITRVGQFLRKLKIDEMPQLLNVLKGEMCIVGPRPEDPRYVAKYTAEQRRVLSVRPGMASPAFIKYRHEEKLLVAAGENMETEYLRTILPDKLKMDLEYIHDQSFIHDLQILFQAAVFLLKRPAVSAKATSMRHGPEK